MKFNCRTLSKKKSKVKNNEIFRKSVLPLTSSGQDAEESTPD